MGRICCTATARIPNRTDDALDNAPRARSTLAACYRPGESAPLAAMTDTLKERYFKYAHRCLDAASKAPTPEERIQFLEMAQSWRSLAEKCDVVDDLVEQAKEMRIIPPKSEMN
jgi:hypothetical protein